MANIADLEKIVDVNGVGQYILIGPGGQIISHNMDNHIVLSSMIISCASICKFIHNQHFQHLVFTQEDGRDFFIFPIGKHYLAVTKTANSSADKLPQDIAFFIKKLTKS